MNQHAASVNTENDAIASKLIATMDANRTPAPGIYRDVPDYEYHGHWKAISNSLLQDMKRSPLHAYHTLTAPPEDPTPAMKLGTSVHAAILQPEYFTSNFIAMPKADMRTNLGKATVSTFMAANPGMNFLSEADHARCIAMRDAALRVSSIRTLLEGTGDFELSFVWRDETELLCKGRADRVSWDVAGGTVIDIKTCGDASKSAFERSVFGMGYYNQGAMYVDGLRAQGFPIKHYTVIAIEKDAPHAIAIYRMRNEVLDVGRKQNRRLIDRFAECMKSDCWPGYEEFVDLGLPQWAYQQLEGIR